MRYRYPKWLFPVALVVMVSACDGAPLDSDFDGLSTREERAIGTNPDVPDTDGDGWSDGYEVHVLLTNPLLVDTDGDGASDYIEVYRGTDPRVADSDGDGIADNAATGAEWVTDLFKTHLPNLFKILPDGSSPNSGGGPGGADSSDRDGDGVVDSVDNCPDAVNPAQADGDSDGVGDGCDSNTFGPLVSLGTGITSTEGATVNLNATVSDLDSTPSTTFRWTYQTLDGISCMFADDSARVTTLVCDDDGVVTLQARIDDGEHPASTAVMTLTLVNAAPTATWNPPAGGTEGTTFTIELTTPTDHGADALVGYTYAFDCGGGYGSFATIAQTDCIPTDSGTITIKAAIQDKDGDASEYTQTITVANVAPTGVLTVTSPALTGVTQTVSLAATDASTADAASLRYAFSCVGGDLSAVTYASGSSASSSTPCSYGSSGTFSVHAKVMDKDGAASTYNSDVVVESDLEPRLPTLATGNQHACAIRTDGKVQCWGYNMFRGGNQASIREAVPVDFGTNRMAKSVHANNYSTCAVLDDDGLKCWGDAIGIGAYTVIGDDPGELGDNMPYQDMGTSETVTHFDLGSSHACAVLQGGKVKCWGSNWEGQLGYGDLFDRGFQPNEMGDALPSVDLGTGERAMEVAVGQAHTCVLLESGRVKCWGSNTSGQLGLEDLSIAAVGDESDEMGDSLDPIDLGSGVTAISIEAGWSDSITCALLSDQQLKCWGPNYQGQLGQGNTVDYGSVSDTMGDDLPTIDLGTNRTALSVSAGAGVACAVLENRTLKCWGGNMMGELGVPPSMQTTSAIGDEAFEMGDDLAVVDLGFGARVAEVKTGIYYACARLMDDRIVCWGANGQRQLGSGDALDRLAPGGMGDNLADVHVQPPRQALALGNATTCAVMNHDETRCWGLNVNGQLGLGDAVNRGDAALDMGSSLQGINLAMRVRAVSLGNHFSCALSVEGQAKCWGLNTKGQLGLGDTTQRGDTSASMGDGLPAVQVGLGRRIMQLSTSGSSHHACAVLDDASVKCWGDGGLGQLGHADSTDVGDDTNEMGDALQAVDLGSSLAAQSTATGNGFTCVLIDDGRVKCFGTNSSGQLGVGDTQSRGTSPIHMGDDLPFVDLGSTAEVVQLQVGAGHACALLNDGSVKCWGNNASGQLGLGDSLNRGTTTSTMGTDLPAVDLGTDVPVVELAAGASHTCALFENGRVKCWGDNADGVLGLGDTTDRGTASSQMGTALPYVNLGASALRIAAGVDHTCAWLDGDRIKCWGRNSVGQLGVGDNVARGDDIGDMDSNLPNIDFKTAHLPLVTVRNSFAAGPSYVCGLRSDGAVRCWGSNGSGQLGQGHTQTITSPRAVPIVDLGTNRRAVALSASLNFACAVLDDGGVKCWGNAFDWVKGDEPNEMGDNLPYLLPTSGPLARHLDIGDAHWCVVLSDGSVKCRGYNSYGQLGLGHASYVAMDMSTPPAVDLGVDQRAVQVACGRNHTCALLENGNVKCWGVNYWGQLGRADGTSDPIGDDGFEMGDALPAVDLGQGRSAIAIKVYSRQEMTCALLDNNDIKCWGMEYSGMLGQGTQAFAGTIAFTMGNDLPAIRLGSQKKATSIAMTDYSVCAVLADRSLKCWGAFLNGSLGIAASTIDPTNHGDALSEMGDQLPTVDLGIGQVPIEVAGGAAFTCVRLESGALRCWGRNDNGELGVGDTVNRYAPNAMGDALTDVWLDPLPNTIAAGSYHSCATSTLGGTRCWGNNAMGELGLGDTLPRGSAGSEMGSNLPSPHLALQVRGIYAGAQTTCATSSASALKCWGDNTNGRLGLGDTVRRGDSLATLGTNLPVVALGLNRKVVRLATTPSGGHTCAILDNGSLKCWGVNSWGGLGYGHLTSIGGSGSHMGDALAAVPLGTSRTALEVATGNGFTCVVVDNGRIKCFGRNSQGQLGLGDSDNRGDAPNEMGDNLPYVNLGETPRARQVAAGMVHACALFWDGSIKCWGDNAAGQLGLGDTNPRGLSTSSMGDNLSRVDLGTDAVAIQIVAGSFHTCARLNNGRVKCWGANSAGNLGLGDADARGDNANEMGDNLPFVDLNDSALQLAAGDMHTCAMLDEDRVKCWGQNSAGQLGLGDTVDRGTTSGDMGADLPHVDVMFAAAASFSAPASGTEGTALLLELTSPIGNILDEYEYAFDCGTGYGSFSTTASASCTPDDSGQLTVRAWVQDAESAGTEYERQITVSNVAPTATLSAPAIVSPGGTRDLSLTATDASSVDLASLHYAFSCDGSALNGATYASSGDSNTQSCNFPTPGSVTVYAKVMDKDGGANTYSASVTIGNSPPTIDRPQTAAGVEGFAMEASGHFTDPDLDPWTATVDYGDGGGPQPLTLNDHDFMLSHTYAAAGVYSITVVVDDGSVTASRTIPATIYQIHEVRATHSRLSVGQRFSCAIRSDGNTWCWGANSFGQLGQGHTDHVKSIKDVPPIDFGTGRTAVSIQTNALGGCALLDDGAIKCWGETFGEPSGYGDTLARGDEPGEMGDALPAIDLGTGRTAQQHCMSWSHKCALLDDNNVKCWGQNDFGQLGLGDTIARGDEPDEMGDDLPAVDLGTGRTAVQIACGDRHSCAILDDNTAKCWGEDVRIGRGYNNTSVGDESGEMGDALAPMDFGTGRTAISIGSFDPHACAFLNTLEVKCWGWNWFGALGRGYGHQDYNMGDALPAVDVGTGRRVRFIGGGMYKSCVILDDGRTKCWGDNYQGGLGIPDSPHDAYAWGDEAGEMGDDLPSLDLGPGREAVEVDAEALNGCALLDNDAVVCWGDNEYGGLGTGDLVNRGPSTGMGDSLVDVGLEVPVQSLSSGEGSTCVNLGDTGVRCWGENSGGQLGIGDTMSRGGAWGEISKSLRPTHLTATPRSIAMGLDYGCAVFADGARCWGLNVQGTLGLGDALARGHTLASMGDNLPLVDVGLGRRVRQIAIGLTRQACAVLDNGSVKCWGSNLNGQLGQGHATAIIGETSNQMGDSLEAVSLGADFLAKQVTGGYGFNCALSRTGRVKCWGKNSDGQLGVGDTADRGLASNEMGDALPFVDLGGRRAKRITAGDSHACALLEDGRVKCWGSNANGRLGIGDTMNRGDQASTMGENLPAIDLGDTPDVLDVVAGGAHTCARFVGGHVKCWGFNVYGNLGAGDSDSRGLTLSDMGDSLPYVDLDARALQIDAGLFHTCAWLANGDITCWGHNANGQLGIGDTNARGDNAGEMGSNLPAVPLRYSAGLWTHANTTCAQHSSGYVKCWGRNLEYQLGMGDIVNRGDGPNQMGSNLGFVNLCDAEPRTWSVNPGGRHTCFLLERGKIMCWGNNSTGPLGIGPAIHTRSAHPGFNYTYPDLGMDPKPIELSAGTNHNCVRYETNQVKCWGANQGRLGIGDTAARGDHYNEVGANLPFINFGSANEARQVSAGSDYSCAILHDGTLKCWGSNDYGQLGLGSGALILGDDPSETVDALPSVDLEAMPVRMVATGVGHHTCAILDDYSLKCWGRNDFGQLGLGDQINRGNAVGHMGSNLPYVNIGVGARAVAVGAANTCVILSGGQVKCWGSNASYQLGLGSASPAFTTNASAPAVDLGVGRTARYIAVGEDFACAWLDNNDIKCWGGNQFGQLGQGDTTSRGDSSSSIGDNLDPIDLWPVSIDTSDPSLTCH